MNYEILASGSSGNCTIIENTIMIDCGLTFKAIKPYYKNIKLVLLTHAHSDHFNKTTIKKLASERPLIRFGCASWLVKPLLDCGVNLKNIDVYLMDLEHVYKGFSIISEKLNHDVPNLAYKVFMNGKKLIYATDTKDMNGIIAKDFDYYLIEANYSEEEIQERIRKKQENGEYITEFRTMETHQSKEQAMEWLLQNMNDNSEYVFMHQHVDKDKKDNFDNT